MQIETLASKQAQGKIDILGRISRASLDEVRHCINVNGQFGYTQLLVAFGGKIADIFSHKIHIERVVGITSAFLSCAFHFQVTIFIHSSNSRIDSDFVLRSNCEKYRIQNLVSRFQIIFFNSEN
jgi:hypothetical protein